MNPEHSSEQYDLDPFEVEVIRHGLTAAAEEMSLVVMRSARSPLLREAGDLSSTLTDADGELIAQGKDIPVHLGVMAYTVKQFLQVVPAERLTEGDAWLLNHPDIGGNHLPDVKLIRPIFRDGKLLAFSVSLAHWADVGGAWPGSYFAGAFDSVQEGLRIPPLRVFTASGIDEEKLAIVLANVRGPTERKGDLMAQMAATLAAERRLHELCDVHGAPTIALTITRLHDLSEREMRDAIAELPDGVYEGTDYIDDGGPGNGPAAVRVRIEISGDEASFDFSDSDDTVSNYNNTTPNVVRSAVAYAARVLSGRDMQPNGGCLRPLRVVEQMQPGHWVTRSNSRQSSCQQLHGVHAVDGLQDGKLGDPVQGIKAKQGVSRVLHGGERHRDIKAVVGVWTYPQQTSAESHRRGRCQYDGICAGHGRRRSQTPQPATRCDRYQERRCCQEQQCVEPQFEKHARVRQQRPGREGRTGDEHSSLKNRRSRGINVVGAHQ